MVRRGKQGRALSTGTVDMGSTAGQKGWTKVLSNTTIHMFTNFIQTPGIVSPTEFRSFWITTEKVNNKLVIKVGKDGENVPFMTGIDENPLKIGFVALSAFTDQATYSFVGCQDIKEGNLMF